MLKSEIKSRMMRALKARNTVEREILGVVLGEVQTQEARAGGDLSDEAAQGVVRKLIKSNRETLDVATDAAQKDTLEREIDILESLLPKTMTEAEVIEALAPARDAIRAAAGDGPATGIAMKQLKQQPLPVEGRVVSQAVKKMRG